MKSSSLYRVAAVLLLLFTAGHIIGFTQTDPKWGIDPILGSLRSVHFTIGHISRTYWDFFVADGLTSGVFYLFAAILAWQLSGLPAETLSRMRGVTWTFAAAFAAVAAVSCIYLFLIPILFSGVITLVLAGAAWRAAAAGGRDAA